MSGSAWVTNDHHRNLQRNGVAAIWSGFMLLFLSRRAALYVGPENRQMVPPELTSDAAQAQVRAGGTTSRFHQ